VQIARIIDEDNRECYAVRGKDAALRRAEGDPLAGTIVATDRTVKPKRWLPPVEPRVILAIGLNYRAHAAEGGKDVPDYPVLFMKNPAAAVGHREPILIPAVCEDEVDFECELAVVIGRDCRNVGKGGALSCVLGYTCGNDVSARIWQAVKGGSQWCRGKSFDTFAPLGPVLVTADEIPNPDALALKTTVNGEIMQESSTSDMIFDVATLIEFLSQDTTLLAGTVIFTGTPSGIGWVRKPRRMLHAGDTVTVEVERIGALTNPVASV